jgi:hypothetical protein
LTVLRLAAASFAPAGLSRAAILFTGFFVGVFFATPGLFLAADGETLAVFPAAVLGVRVFFCAPGFLSFAAAMAFLGATVLLSAIFFFAGFGRTVRDTTLAAGLLVPLTAGFFFPAGRAAFLADGDFSPALPAFLS